ncbi:MAG: ABC transporter substrate-binding protein [Acidimicrobiales bacterium]
MLFAVALVASSCGARFPRSNTGNTGGTGGAGVSAGTSGGSQSGGQTSNGSAGAGAGASGSGAASGTTGGAAGQSAASGTTGTGASAGGASGGNTGTGGGTSGNAPVAPGGIDPGPAPGVTKTEISIGYLLPLTGAAPVPSNFDKGANVYWNYVNAHGGIAGRKVHTVIADTQSSAQVGKDQAKKLIEVDHVFAIVVLDRLENQQAIGAYLDSRHFPNVEIQTPANLDASQTWTFGVTIDHAVQGSLIADYFTHVLHVTKAAIVYENTPTLFPGRDSFTKEMQKDGGKVVYSTAIDGQENDFSQQVLDLNNSKATATWLYMAPTPAAKLVNQADATGYHPTWFANSISWNFNLVFTVAPKALKGARAFSPWLPLSDPRTQTYQNAYRSQTGQAPDDLGIVGWGVGEIVGAGIQAAGASLGQNSFRNAMQNLKFRPDIWAPITFNPGVREGANIVAVFKESNGQWALDHDFSTSF